MTEKQRGILPRKIKGFRDIDPGLNQLRWHIIESASKVYKSYGFEHWDTPVMEYADCLGKYMPAEGPQQGAVAGNVYSFNNPEVEPVYDQEGGEMKDEHGRTQMENHYLALRYDLTAPLARRIAEDLWLQKKQGQLTERNAPLYRRYQYGPVFRYEIKLAPGRFREFWQLDFDTVGTPDVTADAEIAMILSDALEAIGLQRETYLVNINNRKILKGFLRSIGVQGEQQEGDILRVVDKLDKIGMDNVKLELGEGREDSSGAPVAGLGLGADSIEKIEQFFQVFEEKMTRQAVLQQLEGKIGDNDISKEGLEELHLIDQALTAAGFGEERVIFNPILVRGMAYYTGPIFEVESLMTYKDKKGKTRRVGSICGGGRYDGLVENLLGVKVPATGASIGVDRLAELMVLTGLAPKSADGPVFIAVFDDELMPEYQQMAGELRAAGVSAEVYYGNHKGFRGMKKQMKYADKRNCPLAILVGSDEQEKGIVTIKNLHVGKQLQNIKDKEEWKDKAQFEVKRSDLVKRVLEELDGMR